MRTELDQIHAEGRSRPPVEAKTLSSFATSWSFQLKELLVRASQYYWRDPTYLMSKIALRCPT